MVDAAVKLALAAAQSPSVLALVLLLVFCSLMLVALLLIKLLRSVVVHSNRLHEDMKDFRSGFQTSSGAQTRTLVEIRDLLMRESKDQAGRPIILSLDGMPAQAGRMGIAIDKLSEVASRMDQRLERMELRDAANGRQVS